MSGELTKYCKLCGRQLEEEDRFCDICGKSSPLIEQTARTSTQAAKSQPRSLGWYVVGIILMFSGASAFILSAAFAPHCQYWDACPTDWAPFIALVVAVAGLCLWSYGSPKIESVR
jgi:drug/metabolite transporter (DMT)-like permease